ncbi:MAG: hypothetical protein VKI42_06720 [Synechococcaceae cyanobacterium]|nr:hypothetical protein [Synechococcaceae cyanobacterium]
MTKIERSKLEIAEFESDLAGFLNQRKQLDEQIAQTGSPVERAKLQFARSAVDDEAEGARLLLIGSRLALQEAQGELDGLREQRQRLPLIAARVAAVGRAQADLLAAVDALLDAAGQADAAGVRVPVRGLLPGGGAAVLSSRLDLLPRIMPALSVDPSGQVHCRQVATADLSETDLVAQQEGEQ